MPLFKAKPKKRKFGKSSNISKLKSPYLNQPRYNKKTGLNFRKKSKNVSGFNSPGRIRNKPKNGKFKIIISIFLSIGIILFAIHSLFLSDYFIITDFKIIEEGTHITDNNQLNELLKNTLGNNLLLLKSSELEQIIIKEHPEIDKLKIKKAFPNTLEIEYEKFPTVANLVNIIDGIQKKYLVDSQGYLIEENIEQLDLPHIYMETKDALTIRNPFLEDPIRSKERLTYILNTMNIFEEKFGIKILYADFKPREREVHLHTEKYFYIMFDMEKKILRQIAKIKKILPRLDIYNEPLVYIDLRISGTDTEKVIYKRK